MESHFEECVASRVDISAWCASRRCLVAQNSFNILVNTTYFEYTWIYYDVFAQRFAASGYLCVSSGGPNYHALPYPYALSSSHIPEWIDLDLDSVVCECPRRIHAYDGRAIFKLEDHSHRIVAIPGIGRSLISKTVGFRRIFDRTLQVFFSAIAFSRSINKSSAYKESYLIFNLIFKI